MSNKGGGFVSSYHGDLIGAQEAKRLQRRAHEKRRRKRRQSARLQWAQFVDRIATG